MHQALPENSRPAHRKYDPFRGDAVHQPGCDPLFVFAALWIPKYQVRHRVSGSASRAGNSLAATFVPSRVAHAVLLQ